MHPKNDRSGGKSTQAPLPLENIIHRTGSRPFSLHHTVLNAGESCALYLHCHPELELFYLRKGEILFSAENKTFPLKGGDGIFLPPNLIHGALRTGCQDAACEYCAIVFSREYLGHSLPPRCRDAFSLLGSRNLNCVCPILSSAPENAGLLSVLPRFFDFIRADLDTCELSILGMLLICWQELYNTRLSRVFAELKNDGRNAALQRCVEYIGAHYGEQISLSALAKAAGLSEGYFCHSFRAYTGLTPFAYLNRVRVIKSCEYLTRTDKKITEVASLCGYNNISYFNRIFFKIMKLTPTAYRRDAGSSCSMPIFCTDSPHFS